MRAQSPPVREGTPGPRLDQATFGKRFLSRFADPAFATLAGELDRIAAAAWDAYANARKLPHTRPAGPGYAAPADELALDWLEAKAAVEAAQARHDDRELLQAGRDLRPPRQK